MFPHCFFSFYLQTLVCKLPAGSTICRHLGFNKKDVNSVITNYYQVDSYSQFNYFAQAWENVCPPHVETVCSRLNEVFIQSTLGQT